MTDPSHEPSSPGSSRSSTSNRGFARRDLIRSVIGVLHRGGWGNPDVLLVQGPTGPIVFKDFQARRAWLRWTWGWWMTRREVRAYHQSAGLAAVPRFLARVDRWSFAIEYRPGTPLTRSLAPTLPPGFLGELRSAVQSLHERGVVHLDLRHRSNLLADGEGRPVVLDFASAVCFKAGGWPARRLQPWLERVDWRALEKWEVRLAHPVSPDSKP